MCGISGMMMYGMDYSERELKYIRHLASELAIENQARGTHATGFATFDEKGNYAVIKDKQKATDFTKTITVKNFLKSNITDKTTNILIHTRHATQGTVDNNMNNHPIETATTIGIHNGMLYNDDEVFQKYALTRQAQVDSEAIFRLVDHFGKSSEMEHKEIVEVAEAVSGMFTFAFVRKNSPYKMHIVRNDNPITIAYLQELNLIVFASIESYIYDAIEKTNELFWNDVHVTLENMIIITPKKESIYTFNVLENALDDLNQEPTGFKENYTGYYYGGTWNDDFYFGDEPTKKNAYEIVDRLSTTLTSSDFIELMNALEELETNSWADGYKRGRASTEDEMKTKLEKAFNEGFSKKIDIINAKVN